MVRGRTFWLTTGVVEGLSQPVVLGQGVLILPELVQSTKPVSMVATRSQVKAKVEANKSLLDMMPISQVEILDSCQGAKEPQTKKEREAAGHSAENGRSVASS